ncbi:MAG: hypothetical protein CR217_01705 [Beijerinckiaceae bacterium]|nr:MAG: hypothetical protein CR217_01705 [Beijerinckiaceae bacterium]
MPEVYDRKLGTTMGTDVRGEGRWGDFTAEVPGGLAPAGGTGSNPVMYFAGMFARGDGTWGTAIGRNGYTAITQP